MLRRLFCGLLCILTVSVYGSDIQTMNIEYNLNKAVQAIWEGGDATALAGGDGRLVLDPNAPKTAMLKVQ